MKCIKKGFKVNFFNNFFYGTVLDFAKACQVNLYSVVNMHKQFSFAFSDSNIKYSLNALHVRKMKFALLTFYNKLI